MLSDLQIATLEDEGYLIIDNLFSTDDLWPVQEEFHLLVEHQAQALYQAGRLSDLYQDLPFERRLAPKFRLRCLKSFLPSFQRAGFTKENHSFSS